MMMYVLLYTRNAANCIMKFVAWFYTGSHSMFSEFIHSLADTANQVFKIKHFYTIAKCGIQNSNCSINDCLNPLMTELFSTFMTTYLSF